MAEIKISILWIVKEKEMQCFEIKNDIWIGTIYCQKKKNHIMIQIKNKNHTIKPEQIVCIKNTYFYYETRKRNWNYKKIEETFIFGRNVLAENNCWISHEQFIIKNNKFIHMGKNPTYVNGRQTEECHLQSGDQITLLNCIIYYFETGIICSQEMKETDKIHYPYLKKHLPVKSEIKEIETREYVLETFNYEKETPAISLFETISASSMMLISAFIGILIQIKMQPARIRDILWMSVTSLSMAVTCIAFGCIHRNSQNKRNIKQKKKEESQYKEYVYKTLQQSKNQLYLKNDAFNKEKKQWDELDTALLKKYEDSFKIPVQIQKQQESRLTIPKARYNQVQTEIYQYLLEIKKQSYIETMQWKYFQTSQKVWIQSSRYQDIFIRFAWTCPQWKWVWAGNPDEKYTWYPCTMLNQQRLWIQQNQDLSILQSLENIPHVLCVLESCYLDKIPYIHKKNLVYISQKETSETFDTVFSSLDLKPCTQEQLRILPLKKFSKPMHWNQTFSIDRIENLSIEEIRKNQKTLKIPIGFSDQEIILLDLNDAHGLIAGTTGSGKSEFLISLLFQLCIRYSSQKIQYILLDFKGGAFSYAFENFAHCAGIVTNLDKGEMERFQISLESEMEKRQKKMAGFLKKYPNQTAHIDIYNQFEPVMSHIFIIIDEFAQLKTMYPDLLQYLKEIARIGRSLGVHLILSTQKPSGIVDEQIWANSKFRICFKVQTTMDSREVLMHDKAAFFEQSGQFCLQYDTSEKYGISLYSQEPVNMELQKNWKYVQKKQQEKKQQKKVCEYLSEQISTIQETRKWIVHPSLRTLESSKLAIIDDPKNQTIQEFEINYGESCLVLLSKKEERKKWIQTIASSCTPVYIWKETVDIDSCWQLLENSHPFTIILTDIKYTEWFRKENIRLFCLTETIQNIPSSFTYKIASSWNNQEDVQNLFQQYHIGYQKYPYAWIQTFENLYWMKWKQRKIKEMHPVMPCLSIKTEWTKKLYQQTMKHFIFGYEKETCQPFICDLHEKWIFLYKENYVEQELRTLFSMWKEKKSKLSISWNMPASQTLICAGHIDKMKTKIFKHENIVWIGYGSQEYMHILKKKMIFEDSEIIMWKKEKVYKGVKLQFRL